MYFLPCGVQIHRLDAFAVGAASTGTEWLCGATDSEDPFPCHQGRSRSVLRE